MTQVVSPGEFSVRGGLIDLFPMGAALPYRLDLFGDEIESIRTFDADTQRTLYPVRDVRLLPAREFPLDEAGPHALPRPLPRSVRGRPVEARRCTRTSPTGIAPGGIEYYLPLFFDATATLVDYLPRDAIVALHGDVDAAIERFWQDTESRYRLLRGDKARPLLPPPRALPAARRVSRRAQAASRASSVPIADTRRPRVRARRADSPPAVACRSTAAPTIRSRR